MCRKTKNITFNVAGKIIRKEIKINTAEALHSSHTRQYHNNHKNGTCLFSNQNQFDGKFILGPDLPAYILLVGLY